MSFSYTKVGQHLVLWMLFFSAPLFFLPGFIDLIELRSCHFVFYTVLSSILIIVFYLNTYYLIPQLFSQSKLSLFALVQLVLVLLTFMVVLILAKYIVGPCQSPEFYEISPIFKLSRLVLPRHIFILVVSFLYFYRRRMISIYAEHSTAQLRLLKQQIKPHTLFNMLNTIYAQAVTQSEHTAESIAKLSDMIRYALNDSNQQFVPLEQEVDYLKSYVSFEKLRLTDKTQVSMTVDGEVEAWQIPPLLFAPLVENAFKYGISNEVETEITIALRVDVEGIILIVVNDIPNRGNLIQKSHSIGLKNLKTRLELLYPNRYSLSIESDFKKYVVHLKLTRS